MHPLVSLAKKAIEEYVKNKKVIHPPKTLIPEMKEKRGVFVSLKKEGQLRGCIGTFMPTTDNVAKEIIKNAIAAATEDPRFSPVEIDELDKIEYSVDVLSKPEKVKDMCELDPKKYGVIVIKDIHRGLLLPDLKGINTVEEQIHIAKMKAGLHPEEECEIYRFSVKRYR